MHKDAAESLVRYSATPLYANQSPSFEDLDRIGSDVQPHRLPTGEQKAALNELLSFDKDKILAWLTVLRCIEPGFRHCAHGGCLSSQHLDALSRLKDCDDRDISTWLNPTFLTSDVHGQHRFNHTISAFKSSVASTPSHHGQPSTDTSLRSSTSSRAPSSSFSYNSSYGTPRSSLGHGTSLSEGLEEVACNDESNHEHWCTYGEHSKSISTCEGWKRHEREHEVPYSCMPNGPVEYTQHGRVCALCHKTDPDSEHLLRHRIFICVGKSGEPLKKSRKTDMVIHLAKHRVHSKDAAALADRWRYALNKKHFSCGFCVMIFSSIMERLNHIDKEHWRHGQKMDAWKLSNCIRGLLLEQEIQAAWRFLLSYHPHVVESNLKWERPLAEGLQLRLERREETALVLAKAALQLSNYGWMRSSQKDLMTTTHREERKSGPILASPRSQVATAMVPLMGSTYESLQNHTGLHTSITGLLPKSLSSSNVAPFSMGHSDLEYDSSLIPLAVFDDSFRPGGLFNDTILQTGSLMDPNIGDTQLQLSTSAWPTECLSMNTSESPNDNTRIKGHLSESGASLVAQMSFSQHGQPAAYASTDGQEPVSDSHRDINTSNTIRLPTSTFFHSSAAQLSRHGHSFNLRNKPLPPEPSPNFPRNAIQASEHRPNTPMDFNAG